MMMAFPSITTQNVPMKIPVQPIVPDHAPNKRRKHEHTLARSLPTPVYAHQNKTPSPERSWLLLSLAEKYFAAAHTSNSWAVPEVGYQGLIAIGLACLEAVLKVQLAGYKVIQI